MHPCFSLADPLWYLDVRIRSSAPALSSAPPVSRSHRCAMSSASGAFIDARHGCCPKRTTGWVLQYGWAAGKHERRNESPGSLPIECTYSLHFLSFFLFLPCLGFGARGVHARMLPLALLVRVGWHHMRSALRALCLWGSVTSRGSASLRCRCRSCTSPWGRVRGHYPGARRRSES
jgi:hypothetical protein